MIEVVLSYLRNFKTFWTKMAYLSNLFKQICFTSTMLCKKKKMRVDGEGKIHDSKKWNFKNFMTKVVSKFWKNPI